MNWDKPQKALGVQSQNYRRKKEIVEEQRRAILQKEKDPLLLKANLGLVYLIHK